MVWKQTQTRFSGVPQKTYPSGFRNPWQTYVNQASLMPIQKRLKEHLHELA